MKNKLVPIVIALLLIWGHVAGQTFNLLKDINPDGAGSQVTLLFSNDNILYFSAASPGYGHELWKTDGTNAGTVMVADINAGAGSSYPSNLVLYNGEVYFKASSAGYGSELWKTDGAPAGTQRITDICPGGCGGLGEPYGVLDGKLIFSANDSLHGWEIWTFDGTTTERLTDLAPGIENGCLEAPLAQGDGVIYFAGNNGADGFELWKTDGTPAGTQMVKNINTQANAYTAFSYEVNAVINGILYFYAEDGVHGAEMWRSDGTAAGTFLLKDIHAGAGSSYPQLLVEYDGMAFFIAQDQAGNREIYKSDGTIAGTTAVLPPNAGPEQRFFTDLVKAGNTLFCRGNEPGSGYGTELWKTDGTAAGTVVVKDINPGAANASPNWMTSVGDALYFLANDGTHGTEIWISDGTDAGTTLLVDLAEGPDNLSIWSLGTTSNKIFIVWPTAEYGDELWVSDFDIIQLPLTMLEFEGAVSGTNAKLWWKTTDEHHISSIVLERSQDGLHFLPVATLQPNNTPGEHAYAYTDLLGPVTHNRVFYYRLKTIDLDGSFKYSGIVRLSWRGENKVLVYPNPVTGNENIHVNSGQPITQLSIVDTRGVVVITGAAGTAQRITISGANLKPGLYYVRLQTVDGDFIVKPVVVR